MDEASTLLPEESQGMVGVVGTLQVHPEPITPFAMMLTDEGNNGDGEKSDVVVVINCITRLRKRPL